MPMINNYPNQGELSLPSYFTFTCIFLRNQMKNKTIKSSIFYE